MKKLIGYVGTRDLQDVREEDIRALDVINIAFGHVVDGSIVWDGSEKKEALKRLREKNPELKILLSVGGWSAGGFSLASRTEEGRKKMAQTGLALVEEYGLDGIDIDWEYPGTSIAGIDSDPSDGENFVLLLAALREALGGWSGGKMVTIAAGGDGYFTLQTDMGKAAEYLDYVQLMTYDLQGGFQKVTGHHAALYHSRCNLIDACGHKCTQNFHQAGVPMEKLILGVPFYSRKGAGVMPGSMYGLGMEAQTVGGYGPDYTELTAGYIDKNGFVRHWDDQAGVPWLYDGKTFISYEDEQSLANKVNYVKDNGLGGIMYWEYRSDGTHTLTEYLRRSLDGER